MKIFLSSILLIGFFLIYSCNILYSDNIIDKKEAEEIANKLYYHLEMMQFKEAQKLFYYESAEDKEKLMAMFMGIIYNYGNIKNFELDGWKTNVSRGGDDKGEYLLLYYVTRERKHSFEKIYLKKENDSIKIAFYEIKRDSY